MMFSQIGSLLLVCLLPVVPLADDGSDERVAARGVVVGGGGSGREGMELRRLPVQGLTDMYTKPSLPIFGRSFGRRAWEKPGEENLPRIWALDGVRHGESARFLFPLPGSDEPMPPVSPAMIVEYLRLACGEQAWTGPGAAVQVLSGRILQVTEKKDVLDRAAEELERLRQTVAARYEFRCLMYELKVGEQDNAGGVMDAASAATLEKQVRSGALGRLLHAGRATGRLGDGLRFGKWRRDAIQLDVDVEIAQEAAIADPVVETLLLGHQLNLTPILTPDGRDVALFCLFTSRAKTEAFEPHDIGASGVESIERGNIVQIQQAFSSRLPATGAILVRAGGAEMPGLRLLLTCRRLDPRPQDTGDRALLPIGLLTVPALTCEEEGLAGIATHAEQPELIMETMQESLGEGLEIETLSGGSYLMVRGAADKVAAARNLVRYLATSRTGAYRVDLVREVRPVDAPGAAWQALGVPVELLCLGGRIGFAQTGREHLFVGEYDVEVAQKSKIGDPTTYSCFDGVQAVAAVEPVGEQVRVRVALLDRAVRGFRTLPAASPDLGSVRVPDMEEVVVRQDLVMKAGETAPLGDGPMRTIPGRGACVTRLSLRLTRL